MSNEETQLRDPINDPRPGDFIPIPSTSHRSPAHRIKVLQRDGDALKVQVRDETHNWDMRTWKLRWRKIERDHRRSASEEETQSVFRL